MRALGNVTAGHIGVTRGHMARALDAERARTKQVPPAFSAIKVAGERAHARARRGEEIALEPRDVAVRRLDVTGARVVAADPEVAFAELRVVLEVTKGYFVRSLARDLGEALGTGGHLSALRRTRSGCFTLEDAVPLDVSAQERLIPLATAAARALPVTVLTEAGVRAASFGQLVEPDAMRDAPLGPSAWLDEWGRLVAIGELAADRRGRVLRGFARAERS
jgi:tRNA pseudouridine55 synthase